MTGDSLKAPLITIGITAYNAADTIKRALNSALSQNWENFEIIVVNDFSKDETGSILSNFGTNNSKIRVITNSHNLGVAAARNIILERAKGEFVAFFDDDDESLPDRLQKQYQRIVQYEEKLNTKLVICHTARLQNWPGGKVRVEPTMGCREDLESPSGNRVVQRILLGRPSTGVFGSCATCSQMARLSVYRQVDGFCAELRRCEDTDLNIRLAKLGAHFVGIYEPLVVQHIKITNDKNLDFERENQLALLERHRAYLEDIGYYEFCVRWWNMKFELFSGNVRAAMAMSIKMVFADPFKFVQRLFWTLPNVQFNRSLKSLYVNSIKSTVRNEL